MLVAGGKEEAECFDPRSLNSASERAAHPCLDHDHPTMQLVYLVKCFPMQVEMQMLFLNILLVGRLWTWYQCCSRSDLLEDKFDWCNVDRRSNWRWKGWLAAHVRPCIIILHSTFLEYTITFIVRYQKGPRHLIYIQMLQYSTNSLIIQGFIIQ